MHFSWFASKFEFIVSSVFSLFALESGINAWSCSRNTALCVSKKGFLSSNFQDDSDDEKEADTSDTVVKEEEVKGQVESDNEEKGGRVKVESSEDEDEPISEEEKTRLMVS